jgi:hypothetical protein
MRTFDWSGKFLKLGVFTLSGMAFSTAHFSIYNSIVNKDMHIFLLQGHKMCQKHAILCYNIKLLTSIEIYILVCLSEFGPRFVFLRSRNFKNSYFYK